MPIISQLLTHSCNFPIFLHISVYTITSNDIFTMLLWILTLKTLILDRKEKDCSFPEQGGAGINNWPKQKISVRHLLQLKIYSLLTSDYLSNGVRLKENYSLENFFPSKSATFMSRKPQSFSSFLSLHTHVYKSSFVKKYISTL